MRKWKIFICFLLVCLLSFSIFGVSASALDAFTGIFPPNRVVATPPDTQFTHVATLASIPTYSQWKVSAKANVVGSPYVVASANVESCTYWNKFYTNMGDGYYQGFEIMIGSDKPFKFVGNQVFIDKASTEFYFYYFYSDAQDLEQWQDGLYMVNGPNASGSYNSPITVYDTSFNAYYTINPNFGDGGRRNGHWGRYFNKTQLDPGVPGNYTAKGCNEVLSPLWYTWIVGTDLKFYDTIDSIKPITEIPVIKYRQNFSSTVEYRKSDGTVLYATSEGGFSLTRPDGVADDHSLFQFGMFDAVLDEMADCLTTPAVEAEPITITAFGRSYTLISPTIQNMSVWQYVVLICQIGVLIGCLFWLFKCIQFGIGGFGFE